MARRMRNDPGAASGEGGLDMTPMIDVTFQLIIFFMLVTDIADNSKEKLILPTAHKAEIDVVEPGRLVINVKRTGEIIIGGLEHSDADLRRVFKYEATYSPKENGLPTRALYVRADKFADYRHIERIMALAQEALLWRMMFSTTDPQAPPSNS